MSYLHSIIPLKLNRGTNEMAMNLIQFQAGMSLSELFEQFGTEEQCERALETARWPQGFVCPHCNGTTHSRFSDGPRWYWQCGGCRKQVSLRSGTIFHASKLSLRRWFQALFLISQSKNNISALELMRQIGVSYRSAWRVKHKIMQVMLEREGIRILEGDIVIDDAYLGGEHKGKAGRGSENKIPFVAAVQLNELGQPHLARFDRVAGFKQADIKQWATRYIQAESHIVSDGLYCFTAVTQADITHQREVVGSHRCSVDMPCFKWINILISNLKTGFSGTYHAFKFAKYAGRYLAEHQYRFNRRYNLKQMLPRLLRAAVLTMPRPEPWLRMAEH